MLKRWRVAFILVAMVALTALISACGDSTGTTTGGNTSGSAPSTLGTPGGYTCVQGSIKASGSTALAPLVQAVAQKYQGKCAGSSITVNLGGSKTGLAQVEAGSVDIGNSDVPASSSQSDLVDHQVSVVPFGIIVNSAVSVKNLTTQQIKDIYSGKVTNWKQVGGADKKIVVVSRPASSGTRSTFQTYILGGPETVTGPTSLTTDSTGTVIQNIAQTDGSIGYAAVGSVKGKTGVDLISIDGNASSDDMVKSNTYKFWNIEHMYTKGKPKDLAQALLDYMSSSDAKQIAADKGFISIADMSADAIQAHQPKS